MSEFDNTMIKNIHTSRYIASWIKVGGGKIDHRFKDWLASLVIDDEHLSPREIQQIANFGTNGKLELQYLAEMYLSKEKEGGLTTPFLLYF